MKSIIMISAIFIMSLFANATVQEGKIYFVSVEPTKYKLGSGKTLTAEIQVGFLSKADADLAFKDTAKMKTSIMAAMKNTKTDVTAKNGQFMLSTEVTAQLQDSGIKAQTILWNSFLF